MSTETVECPECGRDDFNSEFAMKTHYGNAHEGSIAGVTITCAYCGEKAEKRQKKSRNDHEFCDRDCFNKWQSENLSGEDSHMWEGGKVTVECDWCGNETEKEQVNYKNNEKAFCSHECHGKWKGKNQTGEDNPVYKPESRKTVACDNCTASIEKRVWKVKRNERNFCDKSCYAEWQSENRRGENHPRYVEDKVGISYGGSWPRKRRERLEKDNHQCVVCSKSNAQEKADYDRALSVHHIRKARNFIQEDGSLNEEMAHRLENLITLCTDCHNRWEGIPLRPEVSK